LDLCNGSVKEGYIPEDWKSSVVLPIYKGKGDPMECGSYRGIKLLEHTMKVMETIFEQRIRQQIDIDDMQEKFRAKGKKLYFGFVDLEKTFDGDSKEVIRWAMRKLGVEEWLLVSIGSHVYVYWYKNSCKNSLW